MQPILLDTLEAQVCRGGPNLAGAESATPTAQTKYNSRYNDARIDVLNRPSPKKYNLRHSPPAIISTIAKEPRYYYHVMK